MIVKKTISMFEITILFLAIIVFTTLFLSINIPLISADGEMDPGVTLPEILQTVEKTGCCIDRDEGFCTPMSEKDACEADIDGEWYADSLCNIDGGRCKEGCCELDLKNIWVTERTCEKQSELFGEAANFNKDIADEFECIGMSEEKSVGACVYKINQDYVCTFTSSLECSSIDGKFNLNMLCSNEKLNSSCIKQDHIGCSDEMDEIYWYDSCGNRENIYSSDRTESWNNGEVLLKKNSCNPDSDNSNSNSCGNCDYEKGTKCEDATEGTVKMKDGEFTCKDRNCVSAPSRVGPRGRVLTKKDRINGESWCIYDGPIGAFGVGEVGLFSQDLVGSRHYRYVCSDGKVEVDPCQDYRKEICVEKKKDSKSEAICRVNTWEQCISQNSETGCEGICLASCVANPDCRVQLVYVDTNFQFTMCVPKYPAGFESDILSGVLGMGMSEIGMLIGDDAGEEAAGAVDSIGGLVEDFLTGDEKAGLSGQDVCSLASRTCTSTWVKECPSETWTCMDNCQCHSESFVMQMNSLCVSLGDCGVYSNLMGGVTFTGAYVRKQGSHGRLPLQPAILGIAYMGMQLVPTLLPANGGSFDTLEGLLDLGNGIAGIADPFIGNVGGGFNDITPAGDVGVMNRDETRTAAAAGGLAAGLPFGPAAPVVMVIAIIYADVAGCNVVKQVDVIFNCGVATTAIPGNLCERCDGGDLKPCSKYKCESLNPLCRLINEDTGEDACIMVGELDDIPKISPDDDALNKSIFSYTEVSDSGFNIRMADGECLTEFSPIDFGIKTSTYAMCRYDTAPEDFLNMTGMFRNDDILAKNFNLTVTLPSVQSMIFAAIGEGEDTRTYQEAHDEIYNSAEALDSDMDLYVKCMNPAGEETSSEYKINFCIKPGMDLIPPKIKVINPPENSILRFNATGKDVIVYTDEPADCRWGKTNPGSIVSLENYNALPNAMNCVADERDIIIGYYPCKTNLLITNKTNEFFITCRDQPWLGENESRNIGMTYKYTLRTSKSELKIDSITPNGKLLSGSSPSTVNLEVKTSGGADDGIAVCRYAISRVGLEDESYVIFPITGDSIHQSPGLQFFSGEATIKVKCIDAPGNIAESQETITLELDTTTPLITRVFRKGSELNILTSEEAECYYNLKTCNFDIASGTSMTTALSNSHLAEWNPEYSYHIKCKDVWGNSESGCLIIVRPGDPLIK